MSNPLLPRRQRGIFCFLLLSLLLTGLAWGQSQTAEGSASDAVISRQKLLDEEAADIVKEEQELATWRIQEPNRSAELLTRRISQVEVDQAVLAAETAKVALESIQLDITAAEQNRKELAAEIQALNDKLQQLSTVKDAERDKALIGQTKAALGVKQQLLEMELKHADQLTRRKGLSKERLALAEQWQNELREAFKSQQEKALQESLDELEKQLAEKRTDWQNKVVTYRNRANELRSKPDTAQAELDLAEVQLVEADESMFLLGNQLKLAQIKLQLEKVATVSPDQPIELSALKAKSGELTLLQSQLGSLKDLLNSKLALLKQRQEVIDRRSQLDTAHQGEDQQGHRILSRLFDEFTAQSEQTANLSESVETRDALIEAAYLQQKKKGLTARHQLPSSMIEWQTLLRELMSVPATALQVIRNILLSFWTAAQQANGTTWTVLILLELLWIGICQGLGRLVRVRQIDAEQTFTQKALLVASDLLRDDRYDLMLGGLIFIAAWLLDIVPPGLLLVAALVGVWLGLRVTIKLSHWILNSSIGLPQRQPGLNRLIVLYAIAVSVFGLVLLIAHLEYLSIPLREILDRVFMLLLLPPVYLALRIRRLLMEMLHERREGVYWVRLLGLVSFTIPLAIMSAAVLGIAGFVNLAWYVAGYLAVVISVIIGWLIVRGLVIDLAHSIQYLLQRRSEQSAFWVKSLVEPIHFLFRVVLFLGMVWVIYRMFVVDPTTGFDLKVWLRKPLFTIGETSVDSFSLLGSLVLVVLISYIGRWAREVTYNWLYANIRDLGIRNSLSVFTQYAVVVIGVLIALNIIGINLTSLTVFAGALGVGIGFGMQNIANNFISGLILLAERPVRAKDWVTIGDKEGEVSQIGMRSVTVTTWDNQDVIIPNSDLISNAFINWTRSNNIVRTKLLIGVHYQDDPHQAKAVIEEAVTMQPEVMLDPPPRIWLHQFGTSSVDFWVHYYMDVKQFSRLEVKSKVLFAIWDALKEAGISIPYPQQDVYIKEMPSGGGEMNR